MKWVFEVMAWASLLVGTVELLVFLFVSWNLMVLLSGAFAYLTSYAWSVTGVMWRKIEKLEKKLP